MRSEILTASSLRKGIFFCIIIFIYRNDYSHFASAQAETSPMSEFALMKRKVDELRAEVSKRMEDAAHYKRLLAYQFAFKEVRCHSAYFKHKEDYHLPLLT